MTTPRETLISTALELGIAGELAEGLAEALEARGVLAAPKVLEATLPDDPGAKIAATSPTGVRKVVSVKQFSTQLRAKGWAYTGEVIAPHGPRRDEKRSESFPADPLAPSSTPAPAPRSGPAEMLTVISPQGARLNVTRKAFETIYEKEGFTIAGAEAAQGGAASADGGEGADASSAPAPAPAAPAEPFTGDLSKIGSARVVDVLSWVGSDGGRARQALDAERAAGNRSTLVARLEALAK